MPQSYLIFKQITRALETTDLLSQLDLSSLIQLLWTEFQTIACKIIIGNQSLSPALALKKPKAQQPIRFIIQSPL